MTYRSTRPLAAQARMAPALIALAIALLASACATTPTAQQVCTAEWIDQRTDRAFNEFERDVRPMLRTFKRARERMEKGNNSTLGPLMMVQVMSAAGKMINRFENSQALDDLRLLGEKCDDPNLMMNAFSGFLKSRGAPDEVVRMMLFGN